MEKIFGLIGFVSLTGLTYQTNLTGYQGSFLIYLGMAAIASVAAVAALIALYHIPKILTLVALKITKSFLKGIYATITRTGRANNIRLGLTRRFLNKYDMTYWLLRRNSRLTQEVEALRAEVHSLNDDIKLVVSTWSPVKGATAERRAPEHARLGGNVTMALNANYDFVEKVAKDKDVQEHYI